MFYITVNLMIYSSFTCMPSTLLSITSPETVFADMCNEFFADQYDNMIDRRIQMV